MIQHVLPEPAWSGRLSAQELRGITPLLRGPVNWPRQILRQLLSQPALTPAYRSTSIWPSVYRLPNAAQLRSTHRMMAPLGLMTAMLGLGQ